MENPLNTACLPFVCWHVQTGFFCLHSKFPGYFSSKVFSASACFDRSLVNFGRSLANFKLLPSRLRVSLLMVMVVSLSFLCFHFPPIFCPLIWSVQSILFRFSKLWFSGAFAVAIFIGFCNSVRCSFLFQHEPFNMSLSHAGIILFSVILTFFNSIFLLNRQN